MFEQTQCHVDEFRIALGVFPEGLVSRVPARHPVRDTLAALLENIGQTPYQYSVPSDSVPSTPPYQYPVPSDSVPSTPPYQYPEILGLSTSTGGFAMTANQEFSTQYQYHPLPVPKDSVPDWYPVPVPQNFLGASPRTATPPSLVSTQYPLKNHGDNPVPNQSVPVSPAPVS